MRICLFSKNYGALDGCAQSVFDVIVSLTQSDIDLDILYNRRFPNIKNYDGVEIGGRFSLFQLPRRNIIDSIFYNKGRIKRIKNLKPDWCIVNGISGHARRLLFKDNFCSNNIIIIRESPRLCNFKLEENSLKKMISRMKFYNKYIFVSSNVMNEWKEILGLKDNQISYIPNCINESRAKESSSKSKLELKDILNFNSQNFNISCVASIQYRKGQDLIFKNIKDIVEKIPSIHFHIVGKEKKPESEQMLSGIDQNFKDYFTFHGGKQNAIDYLRASDVMILPSRAEAFPRVTLESMAVGTPVVISDVDGNTEQIKHDITGKIFKNEDIESMISCLSDLYENPTLISEYSMKAEKYYFENFSRKIHIQNFKKTIRDFCFSN